MKPFRARLPLTCPAFSTQPLSRETGLRFECQKDRFTEEQMVAIIRGADRNPVSAVAKRGSTAPASAQWFEPGMVLDLVLDRCANGQQPLTVTDEFTKTGLAIDVEGGIRPPHAIEVLSRLVRERSAPTFLRSDNGLGVCAQGALILDCRAGDRHCVDRAGKPWQNGVTESFNATFRDECLSFEWFRSRAEAELLIERWRQH
jgi:putative transposase